MVLVFGQAVGDPDHRVKLRRIDFCLALERVLFCFAWGWKQAAAGGNVLARHATKIAVVVGELPGFQQIRAGRVDCGHTV